MSEIDNGGTAFPVSEDTAHFPGMTLRQWFAGMALQGMMAANHMEQWRGEMTWPQKTQAISIDAYSLADAMIRAGKGEK